mmetsp:Transcript_18531/g.30975  ORF Transcript_18531/g.30975 Transcript_18531/m.30975 type:complete len:416 (+) Transcript_18531:154-1401(+)|eukprot:CAMPEP_0119326944 /NCGR_PEP_ID=MMETSP1333-20130426/69601_1 /TAXON_ID=418940 /ORGANISM="Scyphosphaera apsteinii, Strain RCC1455" /LENGTH=415 /DNA_ID=CAMNT_0007335387 /DNA_START=154 /DNA_END=1401 /DNA_ORIENTATION=+
MGSTCAKAAPAVDRTESSSPSKPDPLTNGQTEQSGASNSSVSTSAGTASPSQASETSADKTEDTSQSGGKAKTFRERRLSVSQKPDPNAQGKARQRRLSVYGSGNGTADPSVLQAPVTSCGCKSVAGLEPVPGGSVSKINQDRALAIYPFSKDKATSLFGVFDGHGRVGETVSQYVIDTLPGELENHEKLHSDTCAALRESFVSVDDSLAKHADASVSGTTAVACLIRGNHMWLANSGDSRAIIARQIPNTNNLKSIDLTRDHKPDCPDEMRRILQMGGHVTPAGANGSPSRVWHNLRGLAMARSIGDHHAATVGVIAEPEVTEYDITDDDVALIIASDGVWELLTSQTVVDIVANVTDLDPNKICDKIVSEASYMWKVEEGDYRDDITVVVLTFPWLDSYGDEGDEEAPAAEGP